MDIKELIANIFKRFEKDLTSVHFSMRPKMLGKIEGYIECGLYCGGLTPDEYIAEMNRAWEIYARVNGHSFTTPLAVGSVESA